MSPYLPSVLAFVVVVVLALRAHAFAPRSVFFGVTVAPSLPDSEEGRSIARAYRGRLLAYVMAGLALVVSGVARRSPLLPTLAPLVVVAGVMHGYVVANRRARAFAVPTGGARGAVVAPRVSPLRVVAWQLPAWAAVAATGAWLASKDGMPPRALGALLTGTLSLALLLGVGWLVSAHARRGGTANWVATQIVLVGSSYVVALSACAAALAPILGTTTPVIGIACVGLLLPLVAMFVAQKGRTEPDVQSLAPEDCWKWGLFYVNPRDPAVLVAKRFGIGYTINFARPLAWVFGVAVLGLVAASLVLGRAR